MTQSAIARTPPRTPPARPFAASMILSGALLMLAACTSTGNAVPPRQVPATGTVANPAAIAAETMAPAAWAAACADWDEWDKPAPPFRVHGDSYYVGTCGISAILIAGDAGHVLIDTGTEAGSGHVLANVAKLGFDPRDVRLLLASHEHHDHIGGGARVLARTGARFVANRAAASALATGFASPDDPLGQMFDPMTPLAVDRVLQPGETVGPGAIRVTMHPTPGHTPGAATYTWQDCDADDCRRVVYADSLTPVVRDDVHRADHDNPPTAIYRFSDHPEYLAAFRASIAAVAALDCDILLTPHPSASAMRDRILAGSLEDRGACRDYAMKLGQRLDEQLAKEGSR